MRNLYKETDKNLFINPEDPDDYKDKMQAVYNLINTIDPSVIKSFMISVLTESEVFLNRFYNAVHKDVTEETITFCKKQVDDITARYLKNHNLISRKETSIYISELDDLLLQEIWPVLDSGHYLKSFELANHIFITIGNISMDDPDGCRKILLTDIYRLWTELLIKGKPEEKQKMFQWFISTTSDSVSEWLDPYLEKIIFENFNEKEYLQSKLSFTGKMIRKSETKKTNAERIHSAQKWILRYRLISYQLGNKRPADKLFEEYWESPYVRIHFINDCIENGEYDKALQVLDKSLSLDKRFPELAAEYSERKKEIYFLQNNQEAYIRQLWESLLVHKPGDLKLFQELKKQYPKDIWEKERVKIFDTLPPDVPAEELYYEEKMYDQLLDIVLDAPGMELAMKYGESLNLKYPKELLKKYKTELSQMANSARGRKKYQEIAELLREMQNIQGGKKMVDSIITEWKQKYKTRTALLDEIGKIRSS